jgi:hypothetical protein
MRPFHMRASNANVLKALLGLMYWSGIPIAGASLKESAQPERQVCL